MKFAPFETDHKVKISVIIPAFNEEKLITDTIASVRLAAQAFLRSQWEYELIVCDNNSRDRTAEIARTAGATVVWEEINQIARARNRGAEAANGDWLIFVDADSRPDEALFEAVRREIEAGICLAGGATVELDEHHWHWTRMAGVWNWISKRMRWMAGSFIFCEARAFRKVGGFSDEFFVGEELDLSRRLKRLAKAEGRRIVILDDNPLLTSARKVHLYSLSEHVWFFTRAFLCPWRTARNRASCQPWYDGRR